MDAYQRYAPALLRKCQRMLQNKEDAEDIVQGLFVDMLKKKQTQLDLPYLYRAVTNRCINFMKYRENRRKLLQKQDVVLRGPVRIRCDELALGLDMLTKLVDRLDKKSVEILIYHFFDDMTQEEISDLMKLSRKSVGKRLSRIRERVKELALNGGAA